MEEIAMHDSRGALWAIWDLHVHTPASIVHQYPSGADQGWEAFVTDLENLDPTTKVIGVNDYLFVDGYERLLRYREKGRLQNIDLILPVVELRLKHFGGTRSTLSKVNAHVVFSDELAPETIRQQFINALASRFQLAPSHATLHGAWSGVITRDALIDFGRSIIESVPKAEQHRFGSPLHEGFSNLTISWDDLHDVLDSPYFQGRSLVGLGKTEWADIPWADGTIADKKDLINRADLLFVAAEKPADYHTHRESLTRAAVNDHLLDCSDAHHPSTSDDKDRIGNCHTWIKASCTFKGLQQALAEFDNRLFVGIEPDQIRRVREHPSRYIDRVEIGPHARGNPSETWFESKIPLSSGLVAIIGNRGSGKSALAECIALAGSSDREDNFSFLNSNKFRDKSTALATYFEVSVLWMDGRKERAVLSDPVDDGTYPEVQHLPQRYIDQLCNEIPQGERTDFDREIERMVFDHLPPEDRLQASDLSHLVDVTVEEHRVELSDLRGQLSDLNNKIVRLEDSIDSTHKRQVLERYHRLRDEWYRLRKNPPPEVEKPDQGDEDRRRAFAEIEDMRIAKEHLDALCDERESSLAIARRRRSELATFKQQVHQLKEQHAKLLEKNQDLFQALGLSAGVTAFHVNVEELDRADADIQTRVDRLEAQLSNDEPRGLRSASTYAEEKIDDLRRKLSAEEDRYEHYLTKHAEWETSVRQLLGDEDTPDTVLGLRAQRRQVEAAPSELTAARTERLELTRRIHKLLRGEAHEYARLCSPLEQHMAEQPIPEAYGVTVAAYLIDAGFPGHFLEHLINRNAAGSFQGVEQSRQLVEGLLGETDYNDTDAVLEFVEGIEKRLRYDFRTSDQLPLKPEDQIRQGRTVKETYDYIFGLSYLVPRYTLEFGGRPVYKLSPGEKGVLLLMFLLLAETNDRPLIIDQPEDNLDNKTVFKALVGCFTEAKARRQILVVTHNPNLAVVSDADQVIVADMNTDQEPRIQYQSGPIEDPTINQHIVDILEGTRPAFANRSRKYSLYIT